jgi:excinuclease ABC subunit C
MARQIAEKLAQKLDQLPNSPGCYQMHNAAGKVIYVGKAVVLRNRVRSYFHASAQHNAKTLALVDEIADITWWVTKTETRRADPRKRVDQALQAALQHPPQGRQDLSLHQSHLAGAFPPRAGGAADAQDGNRYFGPYTSSRACYQTLDALRRVFPYLDCDREITGKDARPCLYFHIKLCGGPCIGAQSREEYRETVRQLMQFLEGETVQVLRQLEAQMARAADNLQFELAALYRDRLQAAQPASPSSRRSPAPARRTPTTWRWRRTAAAATRPRRSSWCAAAG